MRQLTVLECDPTWAVFNRELVTTVAVAPWLIYRAASGQSTLPWGWTLVQLLAGGVLIQLGGNVGVQWAFGVVGLAVTVPVVFAANIVGGALLGRLCLGEHVSRRSMTAIAMLFASLVLLGIGAEASHALQSRSSGNWEASGRIMLALGVAVAAVAGTTYATLNIVIRRAVTLTTPPSAVAFLVPAVGVISLGAPTVFQHGVPPWTATSWPQLGLMAAAGISNLVGFLALINGLQRTTVVHANAISASQVAMAALAGVALFSEPPNPWLLGGICLTIAGVLRIDRPAETPEL